MNFTDVFNWVCSSAPGNYKAFAGLLIMFLIIDAITARVAVQIEKRKAIADGVAPVKWRSKTFRERLALKMSMYAIILGFGWFVFRLGYTSWGMPFAMIAVLYCEALSIFENLERAKMRVPVVITSAIAAANRWAKKVLSLFGK